MAGVRRATELFGRSVVSRKSGPVPASGLLVPKPTSSPLHTASRCPRPTLLRTDWALSPAPPAGVLFSRAPNWRAAGVKHVHSDSGLGVPELSDPQVKEALNALLATNWSKIEPEVRDAVEGAVAKGVADAEVLATVWSSAQACEKFAETLVALRMALDDLSGQTGEVVGRLPETMAQALEAAFRKYTNYLDAIGEDEDFLSKKVENDLGSILIQMRQRCAVLDPKWSKITLLGTSGLSGSYIELRSEQPGALR